MTRIPHTPAGPAQGLLVCAPRTASDGLAEPTVIVADGSYELNEERVFWRTVPEHEVLRLPLDAPVSVRPLHAHIPQPRPASPGEIALAAAVRAHLLRLATPS